MMKYTVEKFLELGLKERGKDVLEIYWHLPDDRNCPHLNMRGRGNDSPIDCNFGERGFLLGYYLRLVEELPDEYKERNVETPFIEVCPTRERNGCPNNVVQIPLSYIQRVIKLYRKD